MNTVITALQNRTVNEKLKEYKEINVIMNDIQYQEGIMEALETNEKIEFIILSELLPGKFTIKELIEKIRMINNKINIIIFLEKENKELENYLISKGNIKIFYNNEIEVKDIVKIIINKNEKEELKKEIDELKKIIIKKTNEKTQEENTKAETKNNIIITQEEKHLIESEIEKEYKNKKFFNKIKNKINNIFNKKTNKENKIITIVGAPGVGKSVFTVNMVKKLQNKINNILIIDLDFNSSSIQTLFGIKIKKEEKIVINNNYENSKTKIEDLIININSKIKLVSKINFLFYDKNIETNILIKEIEKIKQKYDYIIIDTQEQYKNYVQAILNKSDKIIFITEPNLLQIKKSKNILNIFVNEWKIERQKIYILFNKVKKDSICFDILKEVFLEYNIIGKINFIKNCNTLINQNMKNIFIENKIKKQYKKIVNNILLNKKLKTYYLNKIEEE